MLGFLSSELLASRLPGQKLNGYRRQLRTRIKSRTELFNSSPQGCWLPGSMTKNHWNERELLTLLSPRIRVSRAPGFRLPGRKVRCSERQRWTLVNPRCCSSRLLACRLPAQKVDGSKRQVWTFVNPRILVLGAAGFSCTRP